MRHSPFTRRVVVLTLLAAAAAHPFAAAAGPANRIAAAEAGRHVNEEATVCGAVAGAHFAEHSRGKPTFLDFEKAYPAEVFRVVIWGEDRAKFKQPPEQLFKDRKVCVKGKIEAYRGKPEIVAKEPAQFSQEP